MSGNHTETLILKNEFVASGMILFSILSGLENKTVILSNGLMEN